MTRRRSIRIAGASFLAMCALLLAGCATAVPLHPAPDANNPSCAEVIVRLDSVADLAKRETNAQATAAWGTPASVILSCGVTPPGPSTLPCVEVNGVDWLEDDSAKPMYTYTTFGRDPAVQVAIDSNAVSGTTVLVDLAGPVSKIPATSACTDLSDSLDVK